MISFAGTETLRSAQVARTPAIIVPQVAMSIGGWLEVPSIDCVARLAYDGKGNARIRETGQLAERRESLGGFQQGLYAEEWSPFVKVTPFWQDCSIALAYLFWILWHGQSSQTPLQTF